MNLALRLLIVPVYIFLSSFLSFHSFKSKKIKHFLHSLLGSGGQGQFKRERTVLDCDVQADVHHYNVMANTLLERSWADCDDYTFSAGTPDRLEREVHRSEM